MLRAPAFLFPTTTILVDDDNLYAQLLVDRLTDCPPVNVLSQFDLILEQQNQDVLSTNEQYKKKSNSDINTLIDTAITERTNLLNDMISVMVFDLHMARMTGLEVFYRIKSPFVYKVLISNFIESPFKEEIKEAQNLGVIDAVLDKGNTLTNELPKAVLAGQIRFFTKLSNQFFERRETHNYLADPAFSTCFLKMIDDFRPHFIWPEKDLSSFIFARNDTNRQRKIYITSQDEIETLLSCYNADTASPKTTKQLKYGESIVCHKNPHSLEGSEWPYYMRPARKLESPNTTLYYAVIDEVEF